MTIEEAIQLTRGCAELLEFDPMNGEPTPPHRLEYEQAQAIRIVLAELETAMASKQERWIPCDEKLPEEIDGESKAVLAIVRLVDFHNCVFSENYQIVWREHGEWACRGIVTHWMPLPAGPFGGGKDA